MTTHKSDQNMEAEVQKMMARMTPAQIAQLLADIMTIPPVKQEPPQYDA